MRTGTGLLRQFMKSKTMLFSVLLAIFGIVETNFPLFADLIGAKWYPLAFTAVGIVTGLLRLMTTNSIGEK